MHKANPEWEDIKSGGLLKPQQTLTRREQEVGALLLKGHTAAEISKKLFLSRRTVEAHTAHMKEKLQLRNKAELIRVLLSLSL